MTDDVRDTIDGPWRATETGGPTTEVERDRAVGPRRRLRARPAAVPVVLVLLLLISGAAATWLYFMQFRPEQQTDQRVEQTVAKAAADGTVALLSYSPESLDADFAAARSHLSGGFLGFYNQLTEQMVAAAKQKALKTTASVKGAAVSRLRPESAVVLVLVDQSTSSSDNPSPSTSTSAVLVSMVRTNRDWLISKFEPL